MRQALELAQQAQAFRFNGELYPALKAMRRAVRLDPDNPEFLANLGNLLILTGRIEEGVAFCREAVLAQPDHVGVHSNYLITLHYLPEVDRAFLFEAHCRWGRRHTTGKHPPRHFPQAPDPERRLRVGYVSADFRMHSVAYNFEAFLSGRDPKVVEVFGYHCGPLEDHFSEYIRCRCDHFHSVFDLTDVQLAQRIYADGIDILVFLGGHTTHNRLRICAYKPAPILMECGSIDTIGSHLVDYRLTDHCLDPPGSEAYYLEKLAYLPGGQICYKPPDDVPDVAGLPALSNGYITFGSFNGNQKINRRIVALWAQVLQAVEGSRMVLKFAGGHDKKVTERYHRWFESFGIDRDRISIHGWLDPGDHFALYNTIDIALDTYPYHGCLTTLEGLWMGVPLVSLTGDHCISRVGLSILSALDMAFFTAVSPQEYVRKAVALSQNSAALAKIRATLRRRMAASPLCDARGFGQGLEKIYREAWRQWCRTRSAQPAGMCDPANSEACVDEIAI